MYIRCSDVQSAEVLQKYTNLIKTLASGADVKITTLESPPQGCAVRTVSDKCEVHMMLKVSLSIMCL